jgi:hypothetical protein
MPKQSLGGRLRSQAGAWEREKPRFVFKPELGNEKRFFAAEPAQNDRLLTENRKPRTENRLLYV